ncbi:MAG: hypothetical protein IJU16_01230 [Clostridia bacterium]|nr:hypothetical protein [Clostridia bacterium]
MFKKVLTILLAVSMLMAAIPFSASADVPADARVLDGARFVTLGGSIAALGGWNEKVAQDLNMVLINSGIGGDTTVDAYNRFDRDVRQKDPDFVTIALGTNDFSRIGTTKPKVSLADYRANMEYFVDEVRKLDAVPILISPAYVREGAIGAVENYADVGSANAALNMYAQVVRDIAAEKNVLLVDMNAACQSYPVEQFLVSDGVHLGDLGKQVYAEEVEKVLLANFRTDPTAPRVTYPQAPEVEPGYWTKSILSFDPNDWFILKQGTLTIRNDSGVLKIANTNGAWPEAHYSPTIDKTIAVPVENSVLNVDITLNCSTNLYLYFNGSTPTTHYDKYFVNMVSYFKQAIPSLNVSGAGDIQAGQRIKCTLKLADFLPDDALAAGDTVLMSGAKFYAVGEAGKSIDIHEFSVSHLNPASLLPESTSQLQQLGSSVVDYAIGSGGVFRIARDAASEVAWPSIQITENKTVNLTETPYLHLSMTPENGAANGRIYYTVNGSEESIQLSALVNGSVNDITEPLDTYINFSDAIDKVGPITITKVILSVYGAVGDAVTWNTFGFEETCSSIVIGDVTGDGKSSTTDARVILNSITGAKPLTDAQTKAADINGDSKVNTSDVRLLLNTIVSGGGTTSVKALDGATLVTFGDSLTAFGDWPTAVAEACNMYVFNGAKGGITSKQGLDRFDKYVANRNPDFVTLSFGMNDLIMEGKNNPRVSPTAFKQNMKTLCERVKALNATPILLTVSYLDENKFWSTQGQTKSDYADVGSPLQWLDQYNAKVRQLAMEGGYDLVDIRPACDQYATSTFLVSDGIHLADVGNQVYTTLIATYLKNHFYQNANAAKLKSTLDYVAVPAGGELSLITHDPADWDVDNNNKSVMQIKTSGSALQFCNTNGAWPAAIRALNHPVLVPYRADTKLNFDFTTANVQTSILLFFGGASADSYKEGQYAGINQGLGLRLSSGDIASNQTCTGSVSITSLGIPASAIDANGNVMISGIKFYASGTAYQNVTLRTLSVSSATAPVE